MKKIFYLLSMAFVLFISLFTVTSCGESNKESTSAEEELVLGGWNYYYQDFTSADDTAKQMKYGVYLPASYDKSKTYPLISYIGDATYVGKAANQTATKGQCTKNWIKSDVMNDNPCMFLVFTFKDSAGDPTSDTSEGGQVNKIIDKVCENFSVDTKRLYLTGQSMGGIFDFALNDAYPNKFAATVYCACQPGGEVGNDQYNSIIANAKFASQKFVYIASAKDGKAPYGQADVMTKLDELNVSYTYLKNLSHTDIATTNLSVKAELDKGLSANFFQFTQVTTSGQADQEHMQSFEYCYEVTEIFAWLVNQSL